MMGIAVSEGRMGRGPEQKLKLCFKKFVAGVAWTLLHTQTRYPPYSGKNHQLHLPEITSIIVITFILLLSTDTLLHPLTALRCNIPLIVVDLRPCHLFLGIVFTLHPTLWFFFRHNFFLDCTQKSLFLSLGTFSFFFFFLSFSSSPFCKKR